MTTAYNIDNFVKGVNGFGLPFCTQIFTTTLQAGLEATVNVPLTAGPGLPTAGVKNKFLAVFSYTALSVWVSVNATATVPSTSGAINEEMIEPKMCRAVFEGDVLHFITGDTGAFYGVVFYALD